MREMLTDRGFHNVVMANDTPLANTFAEGGNLLTTSDGARVVIFVGKLGIKNIRDLEAEHIDRGDSHLIVLTTDKTTPPAQKRLLEADCVAWCSVFRCDEVVRNVTRHKLVPRHTRVPEADLPSLLRRWRESDASHLPHIFINDPVARYLGLVEGDVVHIEGPDGTQAGHVAYRRAVAPVAA